jgi:putative transcriptional regulator
MNRLEKSIMKGLEEALAYSRGQTSGAIVRQIDAPEPDVAGIRARTGLSQREFAASIGVALGTLQGWEQGRRRPVGPARVLLNLIAKRPTLVIDELGVKSPP